MPRYDVKCSEHGVREVEREISRHREPFFCPDPGCGRLAEQLISVLAGIRVEDMENAGAERGGDLGHVNLGLPGEHVYVGTDGDGKKRYDYRPRVSSQTPGWKAAEICREHNLTPIEGRRYRTAGQR